MTFRELARLFTESKKGTFKPSTLVDYQAHLDNYLLPVFGNRRVVSLKTSDLQSFKNDLAGKLHLRTIRKLLVTFQSIWTFGIDQDCITKNICQRLGKKLGFIVGSHSVIPKAHREFFKPGEVEKVIKAAPEKYKVLVILAAESGLRRGELLGLRVQDIMFKECKLRITNNRSLDEDTTPKGKGPDDPPRQVPVSQTVIDLLRTHLNGRKEGYVFQTSNGTAIGLRNASRLLDTILEDAEIKRAGLGWHSFRRYRATALSKAGVPEGYRLKWMGHADVDVDNLYLDTDEEDFQRRKVQQASTDLSQVYPSGK